MKNRSTCFAILLLASLWAINAAGLALDFATVNALRGKLGLRDRTESGDWHDLWSGDSSREFHVVPLIEESLTIRFGKATYALEVQIAPLHADRSFVARRVQYRVLKDGQPFGSKRVVYGQRRLPADNRCITPVIVGRKAIGWRIETGEFNGATSYASKYIYVLLSPCAHTFFAFDVGSEMEPVITLRAGLIEIWTMNMDWPNGIGSWGAVHVADRWRLPLQFDDHVCVRRTIDRCDWELWPFPSQTEIKALYEDRPDDERRPSRVGRRGLREFVFPNVYFTGLQSQNAALMRRALARLYKPGDRRWYRILGIADREYSAEERDDDNCGPTRRDIAREIDRIEGEWFVVGRNALPTSRLNHR